MSLLKNIQKSIEKNVVQFSKELSEKYGMPQDEVLEMWMTISKMKIKGVSSSSKKTSPWLQFCKDERILLKKTQPTLKFGEISKVIGEKWSSMTDAEKKAYESTKETLPQAPVVVSMTSMTSMESEDDGDSNADSSEDENVVHTTPTVGSAKKGKGKATTPKSAKGKKVVVTTSSEALSDPSQWTREGLEKMSISELKGLCESIQLSKTGKKLDIIGRLLNCGNTGSSMAMETMREDDEEDNLSQVSDVDAPCAFNYDYGSD